MFLKEIETRPPAGVMKIAFGKMKDAGHGIPEILHLFRFKKRSTDHLIRFTEEVMRGPSPLSRGMRELIGVFISNRNQCPFCKSAHAPVAAKLLGQELVDEVVLDFEHSSLDEAHKQLFRYLAKVGDNPSGVREADIVDLKRVGWSEEAIYDALTVASIFKFYNTWNNGAGVQHMSPTDYANSGSRIISMGYCMDFGVKALLKVMWVGRQEVKLKDLTELAKVVFQKTMRLTKRMIGASSTKRLPEVPSPRSVASRSAINAQSPALASVCLEK